MVANPVFEFAEAAMAANCMEDVDTKLTELLAGFGIDHFVLYQATDKGGRSTGARMCGKRHDDWRKHYVDRNMQLRDDLMRSGKNALTPTTWSRFQSDNEVSEGQQQIFDEASEFGLKDGFYLPLHQPDGSMHGVSMMVPHRMDNDPRTLSALHLLAIYYSVAARRLGLSPPEPPAAPDMSKILTKRQRECLQWVRAGESPAAIGYRLAISEHTVNEHLEAARRRLKVRTTAQAVIEAIDKGLIHL
jgi:DNA-binding CsgD family transcriptional regulator